MHKVCFNKHKMGCDKVFMPEQLFAKIFHLFIWISSPSQLGVLLRVGQKSAIELENKFDSFWLPVQHSPCLGDLCPCLVLDFPI